MEAVAAIVTISSLISLSQKIAKFTKDYIEEVRDAPRAVKNFLEEVGDLLTVLRTFKSLLRNRKSALPTLLSLESKAAEAALQLVFEKLRSHLEGGRITKAAKRLKWPFSGENETEEIINFVHRYFTLFQAAIHVDTNEGVSYLVERSKSNRTRDILDWVCSWGPDPRSKLTDFLERRKSKNAGRWLLNDPQFKIWETDPRGVLWLYGDGGVGKTILTSIVLDEYLARFKSDPKISIVFVYFDYTSSDSAQTLQATLSTFARQLIVGLEEVPRSVERHFENPQSRQQLDEHQLHSLLVDLSARYRQIYVIVDALDELKGSETETDRRKAFLQALQRFQCESKCPVGVLATSRPDFRDIEEFFCASLKIEIKADFSDIEEYVESELRSAGGLLGDIISQNDDLLTTVPATVASKSQGMFLIAVLHTELLRGTTSRAEIDEVVDVQSAQGSLNAIYDQTVARVQNQNFFQARLGKAILKWVYRTGGTLSTTALLYGLALDPSLVDKRPTTLEAKHLRPEGSISKFCASLVMIEPTTKIVRFKHYTTQQYFQSRPDIFPDADFDIAKTALRYFQLHMPDWRSPIDFPTTPDYSRTWSIVDYLFGLMDKTSHFPLLRYLDRHYKSLLVVRLYPEHVQDKVLKTIFTKPPSMDLYKHCTDEVRGALRRCLLELLRSRRLITAYDIKLFLERGVTTVYPQPSSIDIQDWGYGHVIRAIENDQGHVIEALLDFGVRVDDEMAENVLNKFDDLYGRKEELEKVDPKYLLPAAGDILLTVMKAWEKQNPGAEKPSWSERWKLTDKLRVDQAARAMALQEDATELRRQAWILKEDWVA